MMLMKEEAEKELLYSQYPQIPALQTFCCIYIWRAEFSGQRYENETEFPGKVHYSGLYRASLAQWVFLEMQF